MALIRKAKTSRVLSTQAEEHRGHAVALGTDHQQAIRVRLLLASLALAGVLLALIGTGALLVS